MRTTIVHALDELASLHTHPPFDCGLRSVSMTRSTMSLQGQAEQPMMLRGRSVSSMVPDAPVPTLGRGRRAECGLQLGGWGRCALAPLRSYAACCLVDTAAWRCGRCKAVEAFCWPHWTFGARDLPF